MKPNKLTTNDLLQKVLLPFKQKKLEIWNLQAPHLTKE